MNFDAFVEECCTQLQRRQLEGSLACAKKVADVMRTLVTQRKHPDAATLISEVKTYGSRLQEAREFELAIGNIVRRVLHIIREEQQQEASENTSSFIAPAVASKQQPGLLSQALRGGASGRSFGRVFSLSNLLDQGIEELRDEFASAATGSDDSEPSSSSSARTGSRGTKSKGKGVPQWPCKHNVISMVNELIDELDNIEAQISQQAVEHIHANEVILTYGMSVTTFLFLEEASKKREFQVVVAEAAPKYDGHLMAKKLARVGVQATVIADSAIFAMMARANKVLVGAHAVLANGGVIAASGINMVALAAKRHSIPLVVLVGLHKLSPSFPQDPLVTFNDFQSPADVIDLDIVAGAFTVDTGGQDGGVDVDVLNPMYDYIPPNLISLFVTDTGGYTPQYVYRLLAEYYSREDYELCEKAERVQDEKARGRSR